MRAMTAAAMGTSSACGPAIGAEVGPEDGSREHRGDAGEPGGDHPGDARQPADGDPEQEARSLESAAACTATPMRLRVRKMRRATG